MPNNTSFVFVGNPGKKISLEHASHSCPRCKQLSVQLIRSETQLIVLNKRIANNMRVRYECSSCKWKNEELPYDSDTMAQMQRYFSDDGGDMSSESSGETYMYPVSPTSPTRPGTAY
ncbi:hypothetical protein J3Q64DRAFT_1699230 [Phycomyces blakesleeanus]|uniref:Uncharacterized protein n=2 Tax=Phycomyces blakesleeanus TaxID=4837 RepID=A0A162PJS6_PHYB8|nr:hypothetical protein PHYBLDRAFT_187130 [Phycomyces blakesleeanus NRRL 1555(-)]OAD73527.1 hypothetical protein PHYBLDRAFT_187130 [Phycomyces blakesleeanus NRRL 1555(-)]|eukprot:XP_018291567.1 hypothetical protein PHYBLDRAFT_187130 [Phycomyces blakesleeanus NRRL 1555(-)]